MYMAAWPQGAPRTQPMAHRSGIASQQEPLIISVTQLSLEQYMELHQALSRGELSPAEAAYLKMAHLKHVCKMHGVACGGNKQV